MKLIKNIKLGKVNIIILSFFFNILFITSSFTEDKIENLELENKFLTIKILDKVSSKNSKITLEIGKESQYKNLLIKSLKCKNSEFDDNPEITAYIQVKDINNKNNDEVFIFNGWTFASSPSLRPFDHPVYDIWLIECY